MFDIAIFYFLVFIVGICIGSFLNVVILRAFSGESIVLPPSKCPSCEKRLKWYHNIPIISFLLLKGKCAFCKEKISIQYPIVELITGLLFLCIFYKCGFDLAKLLFFCYFISIFIILAVCDLKEKVIFDFHTYFLVIGGLIFNFFNIGSLYTGQKIFEISSFSFSMENSFLASIFGILLGILIMEIFARFGYLIAGTRAFGEGDSYIAAGLGAILGWKFLIYALIYAIIIQMIFAVPIFIKKLIDTKDFKTLISIFLFIFSTLFIKICENYLLNLSLYFLFITILAIIAIYICKRIICGLKNSSQEDMIYLPFGPAMVFAATFLMFSI